MRRPILLLLILVSLCNSVTTRTLASESALSVSPAIYEAVVDPGGYVKSEIYLSNLTNFPLPIKSIVTKFLASEEIKDNTNTFNASSWFKLDPADFILQPSERKKITLTVTAPRNAEPGGHYATIFFQPLIPTEILNSPNALARVGVLAFLIIPGNTQESVTLTKLKTPSWQTFGPVIFQLELSNNGNIHSTITGEIKVSDLLHRDLASIPILPAIILPGTVKTLELNWDYRLGFGKYIFTPHLTYGVGKQELNFNPRTVWLIPWPLILVAISLLTFIYKIFILNASRVKLAWRALRGTSLQEKEQENDQIKSQKEIAKKSSHRRSHTTRRRGSSKSRL